MSFFDTLDHVRPRWLIAAIALNLLLLIVVSFLFLQQMRLAESVINNQGQALGQVISFLQQATANSATSTKK